MRKPTLKDIADACDVSTATVSMVLAGKGSISSEMVEKITKIADELGYVRKVSKRDKGPSFKYVCIVQWEDAAFLWHFSQPFVLQLEQILVEEGFRPVVIHKLPGLDDAALYNEIKTARAGAVFSIHYVNPLLFDKLESDGIPVIVVNNNNYQNRFWSVLTDDIQGSFEATNRLIELGHRRIAYGEYKRISMGVVHDRFFGFKRALESMKIELPPEYQISIELEDLSGLKEKLRALFSLDNPPSAIFVHDDYFAAILYGDIKELGLRVPEDVSLICPGDVLDYSEPFFPRISTMQIDRHLMIRMSWDLLLNRLVNPSESIKVLKTKMHFVDRGSCAAPRLPQP